MYVGRLLYKMLLSKSEVFQRLYHALLIFATIGAAIGTGRQKVKVIDHHKTRKEGKTVYREEYVDAYPLQDLVGGYLQNTFGIIRNAQRNRVMLNQIAHVEELVAQETRALIKAGARKKEAVKQAEEEIGKRWAKKLPTQLKRNQIN